MEPAVLKNRRQPDIAENRTIASVGEYVCLKRRFSRCWSVAAESYRFYVSVTDRRSKLMKEG